MGLGSETEIFTHNVSKMRYLFTKRMNHVHPVILRGVVAVDRFGQTAGYVDEVVERDGCDAAFGDGDVSP